MDPSNISGTTPQQQWLVCFQNQTHTISLPSKIHDDYYRQSDKNDKYKFLLQETIREILSFRTGWPVSLLIVQQVSHPWITVRAQSSIRGGKGGFGTLLRSSARQSGAKLTTDFGACRDLQGRRLRHVNDEIKLRKWREAQQLKQQQQQQQQGNSGNNVDVTEAMFDTPSGLYNWHLMVPSWADISKKSTKKIQRQFRRMQQEDDIIEREKQEKRAQYERSVTMYVEKANETSKEVTSNMMSAVKQGLQAQKEKKRKREDIAEPSPFEVFQSEDRPNSLCTLSGDVVVEETKKNSSTVLQIQSQSDFATLALFLDKPVMKTETEQIAVILYYEVCLVTGGLAQIGWADITSDDFHPNTEEGEGVGDDKGSFGYDGSRGLKFHNGSEEAYENNKWKAGDVVGCQYNLQSGEISYSLNGKDLGVAFNITQLRTMMFPAISCNGGEILELHIKEEEMKFFPKSNEKSRYIPVHDLVAASVIEGSNSEGSTAKPSDNDMEKKPKADETKESKPLDNDKTKEPEHEQTNETKKQNNLEGKEEAEQKKEAIKVEALNLDEYDSVDDLEHLGLDRLKGALMAIGVKCGGSLKERAGRLFSLKGVEQKDYPKKVRAKDFKL